LENLICFFELLKEELNNLFENILFGDFFILFLNG